MLDSPKVGRVRTRAVAAPMVAWVHTNFRESSVNPPNVLKRSNISLLLGPDHLLNPSGTLVGCVNENSLL